MFYAYYEPERAAGMNIAKDLVEGFAENGYEVTVYVPMPSRGIDDSIRKEYIKKRDEFLYDGKVHIHRVRIFKEGSNPVGRAIRYLLLNFAFFCKGICTQTDVMFVDSTPPTQGVLAAAIKKIRKIPYVYNLQDIFPDSMVTAGFTTKGSLIWKIGRVVENITYRNAKHIITISDSMRSNALEKGVAAEKISVVSNWIDIKKITPVDKMRNTLYEEYNISREKFTVLYAGNFGAAQGAEIILDVARILSSDHEIQFVVFGGGAYYQDFKAKAVGLDNLIVNDLLPIERVSEVYSLGDIALITCKKGVGSNGMPSKTWSILACNTPIIASFDTVSDLACVIEKAKAGVIVEPEDTDALVKAILDEKENMRKETDKEQTLRKYVEANADKQTCVKKYVDCVKMAALS